MNGIDISRWNPVDLSKVPCDFVIIKATQGTGYVSPTYKSQIAQADSLGKLLGVYHYASSGGAIDEADHFLKSRIISVRRSLYLTGSGNRTPI